MAIEISAIICTRNRAAFLDKCLQSLLCQTLAPERYEILVVDNGSTDRTPELLVAYRGNSSVRVVKESVAGLSRARNTGWRAAVAPYVGYIDDDAVAGPRWLEDALWSFRNVRPEPAWVGGPIELKWEVPNPGWIDDELAVPLGRVDWGDEAKFLRFPERLGGGNSFYARQWLTDMDGFDERLGRQGTCLLSGEETQLQERVEAAGGRLYYHPGVVIRHFVPAARTRPGWFYRRYYWGGVSDVFIKRSIEGLQLWDKGQVSPSSGRTGRILLNFWQAIGLFSPLGITLHTTVKSPQLALGNISHASATEGRCSLET